MDSSDVWIKDADMRGDMQKTAVSLAKAVREGGMGEWVVGCTCVHPTTVKPGEGRGQRSGASNRGGWGVEGGWV